MLKDNLLNILKTKVPLVQPTPLSSRSNDLEMIIRSMRKEMLSIEPNSDNEICITKTSQGHEYDFDALNGMCSIVFNDIIQEGCDITVSSMYEHRWWSFTICIGNQK